MKLKNIAHDVKNLRGVVKIFFFYKNWYTRFFEYFGLISDVTNYRLRNGLKFTIEVIPGRSDTHIIEDIFIVRPYTKNGFDIIDGNVVDIGANKGMFTAFAAFKKNTHVFSYEPDPQNFLFLKKNIEQNKLNNVRAFRKAVWNKKGKIRFFALGQGGGTVIKSGKRIKSFEVECIRLSDVFTANRITSVDFLKIDCEGAEYKILFSTPDRYLRRIRRIALEYHKTKEYGVKHLVKFLRKKGFKIRILKDYHILHAYRE